MLYLGASSHFGTFTCAQSSKLYLTFLSPPESCVAERQSDAASGHCWHRAVQAGRSGESGSRRCLHTLMGNKTFPPVPSQAISSGGEPPPALGLPAHRTGAAARAGIWCLCVVSSAGGVECPTCILPQELWALGSLFSHPALRVFVMSLSCSKALTQNQSSIICL